MPTRGSAVGLRLCVAAVQPHSCRTTFPPRGAETPPPLMGVPFEAAVRRSALSRILLRPAAAGTRTARACPGPESCRKIRKPTLSIQHFRGVAFFAEKGGLGAPGPLPLVFSLWWHVSMVPFSFSFASTSFAAGAAARASAEQTHFNPEAVQFAVALESLHRGSRVLRRQMH